MFLPALSKVSCALLMAWACILPQATRAQAPIDTLDRIQVFDHTAITYNPTAYGEGVSPHRDTIRLAGGRIVLRKVKLRRMTDPHTLHLQLRLRSLGDPWDKAGSCFVIPAKTVASMLTVAQGAASYPAVDTTLYGKLKGCIATGSFSPAIELLRFMTPFGVGTLTTADSTQLSHRLPVYVDGFAPDVTWQADITDRLPLLTDEVYVGIYIDTWSDKGYEVSLDLTTLYGTSRRGKHKTGFMPLINTVPYLGQSNPDEFARRPITIPFSLPKGAKRVRLHYIVTGHGGHAYGDEFTPRENVLLIDGDTISHFTPWRNDCATFRRYNPTSGVWLRQRKVIYIDSKGRAEKEVEEPIASSDISRSNWCPGSSVLPLIFDLDGIKAGTHRLTVAIPHAAPATGDKLNHWLVSAWLTWEE